MYVSVCVFVCVCVCVCIYIYNLHNIIHIFAYQMKVEAWAKKTWRESLTSALVLYRYEALSY